ncbi:NAD-dependent deacetylase sirtuin [Brachionus plicatilis]|uniref:NAD-dependent deacetylase sirtuin n=1 Tax=Brachionus plicatilis TaxID=10195 RepID=A0A3M7RMQ6_BRAPC|nr:NAD-dependent deacetylase sirtuin [Brachionus plicatilis]
MKLIKILPALRQRCDRKLSSLCFVPEYREPCEEDIENLQNFIKKSKKLFVLTGAGISTESGIPDYRSEKVGLYNRTDRRPIQHLEFMKYPDRRKMYWARNYSSWPQFSSFRPNKNHMIFSEWERKGKIFHHVTQNVDSLLVKAGCLRLTEIHGTSYKVKCMDCNFNLSRDSMQLLIREQNPNWNIRQNELAPDNDVQLKMEEIRDFKTPTCPKCKNDRLKPEVVFFGDAIPKTKIDVTKQKLSECDGLLSVGTSLEVFSAFRIILQAEELKIPIGILNIGQTRADQKAHLKINSLCSKVLSRIKF